jgi:excisionase family DNA binding protein
MLLTVKEFAEETRTSASTVRSWIGRGIIPYWQVGHVIRIEKQAALNAIKNFGRSFGSGVREKSRSQNRTVAT